MVKLEGLVGSLTGPRAQHGRARQLGVLLSRVRRTFIALRAPIGIMRFHGSQNNHALPPKKKTQKVFGNGGRLGYNRCAGWSSQVARWAHNPKVAGSNPAPATMGAGGLNPEAPFFVAITGCASYSPFSTESIHCCLVRRIENSCAPIAMVARSTAIAALRSVSSEVRM